MPSTELLTAQRNGKLACGLCLLTMLGLFAFTLATYADLPARYPVHFSLDGQPDRWTSKDWVSWLVIPLTGLFIWLMMLGSAGLVNWARKHPKHLSMPYKKRFLDLPEEKQAPVWQIMRNMMHWISLPTLLMMVYAQYSTWQVARGAWKLMKNGPIFVLLGLVCLVTIFCIVGMIRAIRRALNTN
ncbi:MAG: DUF1648 domain-containing protein [Deltaproteobacteria bacterium]|nr:DUF1648 domain-containing protein [Deltaproteobacteria bacterium]